MAGVLLTGHWSGFAEHGLRVVRECAVNSTFTFSVPALVANVGFVIHGSATPLWWWSGVVAGLLCILAAYRWRTDAPTKFALLLTALLIGGASTRGHYLVLLVFPCVLVARRANAGQALALACVLVAVNLQGTQTGVWLDQHLFVKVLANQIPLLGMLGLVWLLDATSKDRQGAHDAIRET
jgi:hypothetical protein